MANNRYLEVIKHLLSAETYFRRREEDKEPERERPPPRKRRTEDREPDVPQCGHSAGQTTTVWAALR